MGFGHIFTLLDGTADAVNLLVEFLIRAEEHDGLVV